MLVCDMCEKKMFRCKNKIEIEINKNSKEWVSHKNIILNFCPECIGKVSNIVFKYIENHKVN